MTRRGTLVAAAAIAMFAVSAPARADSWTDWNLNASNELHAVAGQGRPSLAHLALVHIAIYDAVNAIDGRHEPYLVAPRARRWYSEDAAVATAAYRVMVDIRPPLVTDAQQPALVGRIQALYDAALAKIPEGPGEARGHRRRQRRGGRADRGPAEGRPLRPFRFTVGTTVGQWRPEPAGIAQRPVRLLKDVRPFPRARLVAVPLEGPERAHQPPVRARVRRGQGARRGSTARRGRTTRRAAARFWGTGLAPSTWSALLRDVAAHDGGSVADHARLFAKAYAASAERADHDWADKARYSFWRPLTAIHQADLDGNPATDADPSWAPLLNAPPYPEHPSGLSALGGAMVRSLQDFYAPIGSRSARPTRAFNAATPASRRRSRRSSTPVSGPASTSGPRTIRAPLIGEQVARMGEPALLHVPEGGGRRLVIA
jgi:hypothetical protein